MRILFLIILLLLFHSSPSQDISLLYSKKISVDSLKQTVFTLASDSMEGRETGKPGQKRASYFLASKYQSWGLQPEGDSKSLQDKDWNYTKRYFQNHSINLRTNKTRDLLINQEGFLFGRDFYYDANFLDTTISIEKLIFIGNDSRHNPWKKILNSKKYVNKNLVLFDADSSSNLSSLINIFQDKLMPASIFIITTTHHIKQQLSDSISHRQFNHTFPLIYISEDVADKFFKIGEFEEITKSIRENGKMDIEKLKCPVTVEMVKNTDQLMGQNIIALIPGSDRSNETVVISSHYDHLGKKDSLIFFGADDNASGTSAVVEIARVFSEAKKEGHGPRRNILFLNVSGEEKQLLGSAWYVSSPAIPLENTVADLNIDMIGRIDPHHDSTGVKNYIYIIGSDKMSTELHNINEDKNKIGPLLELNYKYNSDDDPNHYYRRSDHYNFVKNGVPVIFYFDGNHADYHKVTDTPDKIDLELLANRARLVFLTAWELANRNDRIKIDKKQTTDK